MTTAARLSLPLLAGLLCACGESSVAPVRPDTLADPPFTGWRVENQAAIADAPLRLGWAAAPGELYVGEERTLHRYADGRWSVAATFPAGIVSVMGVSAREVYVTDYAGVLHRWDGSRWTAQDSGLGVPIALAWAPGTILRYDGSRWSPMRSGTAADLRGVAGRSSGESYAAGVSGTLLHYAAGAWRTVPTGVSASLWRLATRESGEVFGGGEGALLRYDGSAVTRLSPPVNLAASSFAGLAAPEGALRVSGEERISTRQSRAFFLRYDGERWSPVEPVHAYQEIHAVAPGVVIGLREWRQLDRITAAGAEPLPPVAEFRGTLGAPGVWPVGAGEFFVVAGAPSIFHGRF